MLRAFIFSAFLILAPAPLLAQAQDDAGAPQFFRSLNDVPLMPGLYEMADEAVMFDKPEGRIAESAAYSQSLDRDAIRDFYRNTLPQLGWRHIGRDAFVRQDERLRMRVETEDDYRIVHFMVEPR